MSNTEVFSIKDCQFAEAMRKMADVASVSTYLTLILLDVLGLTKAPINCSV